MPDVISKLERCTFEGWRIPIVDMEIRSTRRRTIHEYLWIAGGKREDHGRGIYTFQVSTTFQADPRFSPPLFPDTMNALRGHYNSGTVGTLVVPHIGPVKCTIQDWGGHLSGSMLSGCTATLTFEEDSTNRFLPQGVQVNAASFGTALSAFKLQVAEALPVTEPDPNAPLELVPDAESNARDLFDQIGDVADQILAFRDQAELNGELIASKVDFLRRLMGDASDMLAWLDDPMNWETLYALRDLQAAAIDVSERPTDNLVKPKHFVVDRQMSIMQVSTRIFGTTERARDIMGLNDIPDAMRIPAGKRLIYLPDAA